MKNFAIKIITSLALLTLPSCAAVQRHQAQRAYEAAMKETDEKVKECITKKKTGAYKTRSEEVECVQDASIASFQKHGVPVDDLMYLEKAKAMELASKEDEGELTEHEARLQYHEYQIQMNNIRMQRNSMAAQLQMQQDAIFSQKMQNLGAALSQASQPTQIIQPNNIRCTTRYIGNQAHTNCN